MSFEDKVVIVTGAARGIGRACAERFAQEGANVVLADIDEDRGEKVEEELTEAGHTARFIGCDIAEKLDIRNLIAATLEAHGRIDVLVNNAAILDSAPFLELEEDAFDRVLRVNLKGTFLMGQAVARQMVAQVEEGDPPGAIVNLSSVNAVFALPDHVAYTMSKGGIAQLTKAMALSLADRGIRVNAIGPGSIMTPMLEQVAEDKEAMARIMSRTPVGRFGEAAEIAAIAVFLASPEASYITGTTVYADGGRLALNYVVNPPDRS
ncbi:MAG: glucose 1-dehydrogenase [Hyphomicrobiales bacterium]|nr:glucose 1-dehydrogenase [Hyphomicrobiales bacterium]